jgi:hypothetical protein
MKASHSVSSWKQFSDERMFLCRISVASAFIRLSKRTPVASTSLNMVWVVKRQFIFLRTKIIPRLFAGEWFQQTSIRYVASETTQKRYPRQIVWPVPRNVLISFRFFRCIVWKGAEGWHWQSVIFSIRGYEKLFFIIPFLYVMYVCMGACCSIVSWGTMLQAGRSRVWDAMRWINCF